MPGPAKESAEGESPLVIFQPSLNEQHGIQYETWLTLSNPSDDVIAFKIKLNKSKRYMVKPYQGVIMGGMVVRGEQFPLLMSKLQRSLPDESDAVDGYVAWDIDDKFQVQRAVLPLNLRGKLPSTAEMSAKPKEATQTIGEVVGELWSSVDKHAVSSSVLLSRFMVPVGVLQRLQHEGPDAIIASDLGEEVQLAAAQQATEGPHDEHTRHAASYAAPPAAGSGASGPSATDLATIRGELEKVRKQYTEAMAERLQDEAARTQLEGAVRSRDQRIVQLERAAADLRAQVESANARAAALEIDGADVNSAGEESPKSSLRHRGAGDGAGAAQGDSTDAPPVPAGFALWQLAVVAIIMFLVGRIV